jgi:hypothetical protein
VQYILVGPILKSGNTIVKILATILLQYIV